MLINLLRYEIKAGARVLLPLYGALLLLAVINGFSLQLELGFLAGLMAFALFCLLFGGGIVTLILIIQRFWTNLLKDEGYLMFTLPVSSYTLVASKTLAALLWVVLGILAGIAAFFLLLLPLNAPMLSTAFQEMSLALRYFFETLAGYGINGPYTLCMIGLLFLVSIPEHLLLLYASMSFGQMFHRYRGVGTCGIYLLASYLQQQLTNIVSRLIFDQPGSFFLFSYSVTETQFMAALYFQLATSLLFACLYFWLSGRLLKTRLNLE